MIIKYKLHRVRLNKGGYELPKGERYWGIGLPLWRYELTRYDDRKNMNFIEELSGELRASSKFNALADLKVKYYYFPLATWLKVTGPAPQDKCINGHDLKGNNVIYNKDNDTRHCKTCCNNHHAHYRMNKRIKRLNEIFEDWTRQNQIDFGTFFYDKVMIRKEKKDASS